MDHELPKAYDPALIEEKWAKFWVDERLFDVPTPAITTDLSSRPESAALADGAERPAGGAAQAPNAPQSPGGPFTRSSLRVSGKPQQPEPENSGAPYLDSEMAETAGANATHKPFVQLLPPPNVTGRLHMGHMLNQTEMDILTRWHRMSGDTAVWVPGTDHAGIATQMMVERQLKTEGLTRQQLGRTAFTERVWAWKQQYGSAITDQMRRLGASVDWSREYFTMDDRLSVAVKEAFVRLYEQGLIYRGAYIVNWDPQLQSAVSDLEVESEERLGSIYHIRYDLADGTGSITIATTRPETMLGDVAVAVNATDERYSALLGKTLILPLSAAAGKPAREIPVIADDWANPEFGTGAVKVTPAHDPNDFAIGQRHNLPSPSIMDTQARILLDGSPYNGLDRFEARKQIVADLEAAGHLVAVKDHTLTLPISQRTGVVIEPRLSMQWFLAVNKTPAYTSSPICHPERSEGLTYGTTAKPGAPHLDSEMWAGEKVPGGPFTRSSLRVSGEPQNSAPARNSIAANAIAAVRSSENPGGHIRFTPEMYTKTYNEWMSNIHDWCLSRQLWWGHRIPAWHCNACGAITVSRDVVTACSGCGITDIHQETDVLDTWFSSGLLPFTVFGWTGNEGPGARAQGPDGTLNPEPRPLDPDLAAFYPTQVLVTGFDILFFWVARMIMLGTHFMLDVPMPDSSPRTIADAVPFREVYIHALVRDANREKMSKTKGNVIDPIEIVTKYGTDAVRFTLASQASPGTDIAFNEARTEGYRAFANKIWNAARFLQMNIDRAREAGYKITLNPNSVPHNNAVILSEASRSQRDAQSKDPECVDVAPTAGTFSTTATPLETRWIYARLSAVSAEVDRALAVYRFDEAANAIYQFFWGEFCDWYLELVKLRLNFTTATDSGAPHLDSEMWAATNLDPTTSLTLNALISVFEAALRLLSPFMPFLTEELWHALYASIGQPVPAKSIALTRYPQAADFPADLAAVETLTTLQDLIVTVRGLRKELAVPEKEATPIRVFATGNAATLAQANADMLAKQARVSAVEIAEAPLTGNNTRSTAAFDVAVLYERQIDVPAERERLTKDLVKFNKGIEAAQKQLGNEGFIARAPAHIVEGLKKQFAETTALKEKAEAALAALPSE